MNRSITSQILFRTKLTAIISLLAFCTVFMVPVDAAAQTNPVQKSANTVLVTGTAAGGAIFNGTLKVTSVTANSVTGALTAAGNLTGTLTSATGTVIGTVTNQAISGLPVTGASASCTILTLTLGPLDLNLLGLMVHLNQVVLTITAQPGPGNLLGNLLCDVANLLNGGSLNTLLQQLVNDLNAILSRL